MLATVIYAAGPMIFFNEVNIETSNYDGNKWIPVGKHVLKYLELQYININSNMRKCILGEEDKQCHCWIIAQPSYRKRK